MLTKEQNERLTRTDKGTPCGELMRRYWQPVAMVSEIPPDSRTPLAVTLLGEELVLFRDQAAQPGLLGLHCPHRGADLSYGFVDECGLRCLYHAWAFDAAGRCTDQPGVASSTFKTSIAQTAYPCIESGGLILAYLGPGEPPVFPRYGFADVPDAYRTVIKILNDCNYLQGVEGEVDPHHLAFLHGQPGTDLFDFDLSPRLKAENTSHGIRLTTTRTVKDNKEYIRRSNFIMPNLGAFTSDQQLETGFTLHWHVPITDTSHWKYLVSFEWDRPLADSEHVAREVDEMYVLRRNPSNRYRQDRERDGGITNAGMGRYFQTHDAFATESQGPIQDRTHEHLSEMDVGITRLRRCLFDGIAAVEAGRDPLHVMRAPSDGAVPDLITNSEVVPAKEVTI